MNEPIAARKKLIEVALPLKAINDACIHEATPGIRLHPRGLHKWWAQRRLASVRAVLFGSMVDDPSNFLDEKSADKERERLFGVIEKMVQWDSTYDERVLGAVRREISRACGKNRPEVIDPFCGNGSISLEAQRFGLYTFASDLNPVAVLITKALVEFPNVFAGKPAASTNMLQTKTGTQYKGTEGISADIMNYGNLVREEAFKRIGKYYPKRDGRNIVAWIWARKVQCPNPACRGETPLVRSFELARKKNSRVWIKPVIQDSEKKKLSYTIREGKGELTPPTVNKKGARCVFCHEAIPFTHIKEQGKNGRISHELMATVIEGDRKRIYIPPDEHQMQIEKTAKPEWVPESELPQQGLGFRVQAYGITKHSDLFTNRVLLALSTFSTLISENHSRIYKDAISAGYGDDNRSLEDGGNGARAYADAIATYLAFAVDRCADMWSTISSWQSTVEAPGHTFARAVLPMGWEFGESNPFSDSRGSWLSACKWISQNVILHGQPPGVVGQLDASKALPTSDKGLICTDPPYFNNIGYADLSDFFYVWLRASIGEFHPKLFATMLTPKSQELVVDPSRFEGQRAKAVDFYMSGMRKAFELIKNQQDPQYPISIYYAYKETNGGEGNGESFSMSTAWEAILTSLIGAGLQITGTWPMRTERLNRSRAIGSNALSSSIVLVCRPKSENAPMSTRNEFVRNLRKELPKAIKVLRNSNIAPVDLAQAAIGPGMAVFSRSSRVIEASSVDMSVRTALEIINQELDTYLNEQDSELDPETRFCVAWFEQHGNAKGLFGEADVLARAKNTSVAKLVSLDLVEAQGGFVGIKKRDTITHISSIASIERPTVWRCLQELTRALEEGGEVKAASIVDQIGKGLSETAKDLAYRMYSVCEKNKISEEAFAYNTLVSSWYSIIEKAGLGTDNGQMKLST